MTSMVEPEWDEQTRALVLGDVAHDATLCPLCGRPKSVCQAAENADRFIGEAPVRCHATTAVLLKQKGFTEESNPGLRALLWGVRMIGEEGGELGG